MTNTEYFNQILPEISSDIVGAILVNRGLSGNDEYTVSKESQLAEADILMRGVVLPEFSEGKLSMKYNISELKKKANLYYRIHEDPLYDNGQPTIKKFKLG